MRESVDIDFLISPKDIAVIEDYLIACHYLPKHTVPRSFLSFYTHWFKDLVYTVPAGKASKGFSVEMHWRLTDRFAGTMPDYDFFYHNNSLNTTEKDFLLTSINHFAKDLFCKFKYCIDIAAIIQTKGNELNYERLLQTAARYGFEKRMLIGLGMVNDLLGISLGVNNARLKDAIATYRIKALQQPVYIRQHYILNRQFLIHAFLLQDTLSRKTAFVLKCLLYVFIPTELDLKNYRLPAYTLPLLFIVRPFRLLQDLLFKRQGK